MLKKTLSLTGFFLTAGLIVSSYAQQINIRGTVRDAAGKGIAGAMVAVVAAGKSAMTDTGGAYSIVYGTTLALPRLAPRHFNAPALRGGDLYFSVAGAVEPVSIELYDPAGRRATVCLDRTLPAGEYRVRLAAKKLSSQLYIVKARINGAVSVFPMPFVKTLKMSSLVPVHAGRLHVGQVPLGKAAAVDSMLAGAVGYTTAAKTIDAYAGIVDFVLDRAVSAGSVMVVQTSQAGDRLSVKSVLTFGDDDGSTMSTITVLPDSVLQRMFGFGYAFTETSVYNLAKVSADKRKRIMNAVFNPFSGVGTTMMRTQIGSCDFSVGRYDYDSVPGDYTLANFSIEHEKKWMLPMIKEALAVPGADIKIFGSPWSPPAWMKSNNSRLGGGTLKTDCYGAWALYFSKYLQGYAAEGVVLWAVTIQNEPQAVQGFESCIYSAEQERDFLKNNLGPQLKKDGIIVSIYVHDHNKDNITRAATILSDPVAYDFAAGTAFHWYGGTFSNVAAIHNQFPNKNLIGTEVAEPGPKYGDWGQAERETGDLIGDVNAWAQGWTEWNLVCDEKGGPTWSGSVGSTPVHTDFAKDSIIFNPHYFYIGHFSKYVRPGAVRIGYTGTANMEVAAFKNANGIMVLQTMNRSGGSVTFKLKLGTQIVKPTVPAHSMTSFIF